MKKVIRLLPVTAFVCFLGVALTGCPSGDKDAKKVTTGAASPDTITVKQGAEATATVKITLGKDLKKGTVKASVKDAKNVDVTVDPATIEKTGETSVKVTVKAKDDAEVTDKGIIEVTPTIEGATPAATAATIKLKVEAKAK